MIKLLSLLAVGMFLTLLIGGEDNGQVRQGLLNADAPVNRPVVRTAAAPEAATPQATAPKADVTLAAFAPTTPAATKVEAAKPGSAPIVGGFVVMEADKAAAVVPAPEAEPAPELPIMYVSSRSVNVRGGPSTDYEVVGRLTRAEAVTVVSPEQDGWVQIRIEGDGIDGYIAARLLSETDPSN